MDIPNSELTLLVHFQFGIKPAERYLWKRALGHLCAHFPEDGERMGMTLSSRHRIGLKPAERYILSREKGLGS